MSFFDMYLIGGGAGSADFNAGTSIGAAQATTTNGNWDATTGVFIAASGTPFAATSVGDYASVYVDGATVTTFVAKVTTVTSSTIITVDITTLKYGTAPSTSATGRSCTINGSWNSEIVLAATGLASTTVPQSTKINIKAATYTLAASRTISMTGSATATLWFSGYNTTPGDMDANTTDALTPPVIAVGTNTFTQSGALQLWSNVSVTANKNGNAIVPSGAVLHFVRCRFENTNSGTSAAITGNSPSGGFRYCWFKVPTTATASDMVAAGSGNMSVVGCVFLGGGRYQIAPGTASPRIEGNVFRAGAGGISASTGGPYIRHNTFANLTGDAINWSGAPGAGSVVASNLFTTITGTAINNASGTNTNNIQVDSNDFHACGATTAGLGDTPQFYGQTDGSSPVTSATDMTPAAGSNARNNGFPGIFENETYKSYPSIGAVQQQDLPPVVAISNVAIFQPRQSVDY